MFVKPHADTPNVFITYKLLAAIMCLLSGREPIAETKELEDLSDSYGFDQYFYIDMDPQSRFLLFLAEKYPSDSALWEIMNDYTYRYQKGTLVKEEKLKDKSSLLKPINTLDFKQSEEKTRIYLSQLQQQYGNKFYVDFFSNPFSEEVRWLECIWILRKWGELELKEGHIHLTGKFVSVNTNSYLGVLVNENGVFYRTEDGEERQIKIKPNTNEWGYINILVSQKGVPISREKCDELLYEFKVGRKYPGLRIKTARRRRANSLLELRKRVIEKFLLSDVELEIIDSEKENILLNQVQNRRSRSKN